MVALDFPPVTGGIQTYLAELARRLPVHVIAPAAPAGLVDQAIPGVTIERVPAARRAGWWAVPPLAARAVQRYAQGGFAGVLLGHVKLAAAVPVLAAAGARRCVVFAYGMEVTSGRCKRLERFGLKRAWRVVTISDYTGAHLERLGVPRDRLRRVPPGVALPPAPATNEPGPHEPGPPLLLTVGRIETGEGYKGHDRMLEVLPDLANRFPGLTWVVVGAGSGLPALAAAVRARGLEGVAKLVGAVDAPELAALYARADVFVLPSSVIRVRGEERFEGFGIVYLEAASHGCPVVAGRAGGAPEAVDDGRTGLVVDAAAAGELSDALARLLADPALRRRMGEAGRQRVADGFTWDHAAQRLARVLEEPA